jgi:hypothetical protein
MKGFLVLLVLAAAGLAGVLYWRRALQELRAPVVAAAGAPAKEGRERRKRRRRGARRLGRNDVRNDVFVASAPAGEGPAGEMPSPSDESRAPASAPAEERAPLAPGGSATTEAAPSEVFGALAPSPAAPNGKRQPVSDEPEPIKLGAADLRIVGQGEDLSRPEVVHLDMSDDGHELSQDEIDARFRAKEDAVLACIARARPDEYTWVPGQVTVKFRILRAGGVKGVRVEAPAILLKGGLYGCVKGIVGGMRFPAGTMNQIVTYPFSLT